MNQPTSCKRMGANSEKNDGAGNKKPNGREEIGRQGSTEKKEKNAVRYTELRGDKKNRPFKKVSAWVIQPNLKNRYCLLRFKGKSWEAKRVNRQHRVRKNDRAKSEKVRVLEKGKKSSNWNASKGNSTKEDATKS